MHLEVHGVLGSSCHWVALSADRELEAAGSLAHMQVMSHLTVDNRLMEY